MTVPEDADNWVWLARIRHPQGRKGEVFAEILTDFPEKFAERKQLWLLGGSPAATPISAPRKPGSSPKSSPAATSVVSQKPQASGHDFSRAAIAAKSNRASAPAGSFPPIPAPREVELLNHWPHKGGIVLHFARIDSISAAETLQGLIVAIPRSERVPLAGDEVYVGDLIGCSLIDVAPSIPQLIGEIDDVDRTAGPVALLVVCGAAGEVLVPFAKSYLRRIDLEAKRVEMALPEGLVELNTPGK